MLAFTDRGEAECSIGYWRLDSPPNSISAAHAECAKVLAELADL